MRNPTLLSELDVAAVYINNYLWGVIKKIDPDFVSSYNGIVPFFPLSESASGDAPWNDKPSIVYDRLFTVSKSPFYPIKTEQIHYAVKATENQSLYLGSAIQLILDRQDDAAKDINEFMSIAYPESAIRFHHLRVYQPASAVSKAGGGVRDFTTRQYQVSKFFVDAEYHTCAYDDPKLFSLVR
jgi:hypothetical protein